MRVNKEVRVKHKQLDQGRGKTAGLKPDQSRACRKRHSRRSF